MDYFLAGFLDFGTVAGTGALAKAGAVVQDGRIAYVHAYRMQREVQPAQVSARYSIGSVSKQFTAAAILLLADDGKLSLDDPVAKYLPALTRANVLPASCLKSHLPERSGSYRRAAFTLNGNYTLTPNVFENYSTSIA